MLDGFARHGLLILPCMQKEILMWTASYGEDTGIVLGTAIIQALGDKQVFALWEFYAAYG